MTENVLDTEYIHLELKNGIIVGYFKNGLKIDLDISKKIVEQRLAFFNGNEYPMLIDGTGVVSMTRDARDYLSSDLGVKGIKAGALLSQSVFTTFLANFFVKITVIRPKVPTRIFLDKNKSIQWLKKFKD